MIIAEWSLTGEYVKILAIKLVKSGRGRISQRWLLTREFLKRYSIRLINKTVIWQSLKLPLTTREKLRVIQDTICYVFLALFPSHRPGVEFRNLANFSVPGGKFT